MVAGTRRAQCEAEGARKCGLAGVRRPADDDPVAACDRASYITRLRERVGEDFDHELGRVGEAGDREVGLGRERGI